MPRNLPSILDGLEILRGWTQIAAFLNIAPRTARFWSSRYHLPVHESGSGGIWAFPTELRRFEVVLDQLIQERRKAKGTRKWRPMEKRIDHPLHHQVDDGDSRERQRQASTGKNDRCS